VEVAGVAGNSRSIRSVLKGTGCQRDNRKTERIPPVAKARQGRPLNVSPARKGWDIQRRIPSAIGATPCVSYDSKYVMG
jgi:hypothetical protein